MSWTLRVPYRSRDYDLADVALASREIADPEDRAVARAVAIDAATRGGLRSAGDLIDHVAGMSQPARRELLNRARVENGLPTVEDVVARRKFEAANATLQRRQRPIPACAVCGRPPTGPGGFPAEVAPARRWHCPEHVAQAQPGDMDAPAAPVDMLMREIDPDEIARVEREDALRAEAERQRRDERELRAREAREVAGLREEQFQRELFGGRS